MEMPAWVKRISPLAGTISEYRRDQFLGDLIAGIIVAIMLIPQAMAYAMLAGLPPQVVLYASIVPLVLYSVFGSSNSLAVGPVAMASLLVLSGVSELAEPGTSEYIGLCLTLALLVGVLQIVMAAFRLGFAFSVSFLTPLFYYIPNAALAAIIIVAVVPLVDLKAPFKLWAYSPADCLARMATFVAALAGGIESGILVGVATTVVLISERAHLHVGRRSDATSVDTSYSRQLRRCPTPVRFCRCAEWLLRKPVGVDKMAIGLFLASVRVFLRARSLPPDMQPRTVCIPDKGLFIRIQAGTRRESITGGQDSLLGAKASSAPGCIALSPITYST